MSDATKVGVSLSSGVIAGVAAAIISHPADSLLSMVNKEGGSQFWEWRVLMFFMPSRLDRASSRGQTEQGGWGGGLTHDRAFCVMYTGGDWCRGWGGLWGDKVRGGTN